MRLSLVAMQVVGLSLLEDSLEPAFLHLPTRKPEALGMIQILPFYRVCSNVSTHPLQSPYTDFRSATVTIIDPGCSPQPSHAAAFW